MVCTGYTSCVTYLQFIGDLADAAVGRGKFRNGLKSCSPETLRVLQEAAERLQAEIAAVQSGKS